MKIYEQLWFKILIRIGFVLAIIVSISFYVLLKLQERELIRNELDSVNRLASAVRSGLEHAMLNNNHEEIRYIVRSLSRERDIINLDIINFEGEIKHSSNPKRVGIKLNRMGKGCGICHRNEKGAIKHAVIISEGDTEFLRTDVPIFSKPACLDHHPKRRILGGIIIDTSTSKIRASLYKSFKRMAISALLTFLALVFLTFAAIRLTVICPVKDLMEKMFEVMRGDMEARAEIKSNDEIGNIARTFNLMVAKIKEFHERDIKREREMAKIQEELRYKAELESLNLQLEKRIKEVELANMQMAEMVKEIENKNIQLERIIDRLKMLNRISIAMASLKDSDEILKMIVDKAVGIMKAKIGSLMVIDEKSNELVIKYAIGLDEETVRNTRVRIGEQVAGWVAEKGVPLLVEDVERDERFRLKNNPKYETKSLLSVPVFIKDKVIGVLNVNNKKDGGVFTQDELELLVTLAGQTGVALENSKLYKELQKSYFETIRALVNAIEAKDKYTKGHSEKVTQVALLIAEKLGLSDREKNILKHAAVLHDIGKIGIDLHILQKKGKLTPEERAIIEEHPLIGEHILEPIEFLKEVREIIHQHHERVDGKGYPNGIKGDNLSLLSKILTIADAYEAMSSDRPYRKAKSKAEIIEELRAHKGTQFDPMLVDLLVEMIERDEMIPLSEDFWDSRGVFLI